MDPVRFSQIKRVLENFNANNKDVDDIQLNELLELYPDVNNDEKNQSFKYLKAKWFLNTEIHSYFVQQVFNLRDNYNKYFPKKSSKIQLSNKLKTECINIPKRKKTQIYDEFVNEYKNIQLICKNLYQMAEDNNCEQQMDLLWLIRNIENDELKNYVKILFGMTWNHADSFFRLKLSVHSLSGFKISYRCGMFVDIDSSPEALWKTNANNYEQQFDREMITCEDDLTTAIHQNSLKMLAILNSAEQQTSSKIKNIHLFPIME